MPLSAAIFSNCLSMACELASCLSFSSLMAVVRAFFSFLLDFTTFANPFSIAVLRAAVCAVMASTTPAILRFMSVVCWVMAFLMPFSKPVIEPLISPPCVVMAVPRTEPWALTAATMTSPFVPMAVTILPPCCSIISFRAMSWFFMPFSMLTMAVVLSLNLTVSCPVMSSMLPFTAV